MEFTAKKDDLLRELTLIQGIVERKNTIPILANVLIEVHGADLELSATDLDVGLRCRLSVETKEEGSLTLSAKKLFEIVRAVPETEIRIKELENFWASITSGRSYFKMVGMGKTEFPSLAEPPKGKVASIPGSVLGELINKTSFAITADDNRYFLNGARLELTEEKIQMISTDGHRLAYISMKRPAGSKGVASVVIPKKTLLELLKMLGEGENEVAFSSAENNLFFQMGERLLISKKLDDQFPAYDKVIPKGNDKLVTCGRDDLMGAIRRVSLLANERSRAVKLGINQGKIEVSSQNPELGEARETIEAGYDGEALEVGFNGQYLLDFLSAAGKEAILLELKDDSSQGLLRPAEETEADYCYVVMPMRL